MNIRQDMTGGVELSSYLSTRDVAEARAIELEQVDDLLEAGLQGGPLGGVSFRRKAARVRLCAPLDGEGGNWTCKQRECQACAQRLANRRWIDFAHAIRSMRHPVLILATMRSRALHDLRPTIGEIRRALTRLLQRKMFGSNVRAVLGVVEPKLAEGGHYWTVHTHLVLDIDAVPWGQADAAWYRLSHARGRFLEDLRPLPRRSGHGLATYLAKGTDACPAPGTFSPRVLAVLWTSLFRVQLVMRRGPDVRRGRSRAPRRPRVRIPMSLPARMVG
jgi:hypothetical protein